MAGAEVEVWVVERGRHRYPMLIVAEADPNGDQEADRAAIQAIIGSLDFL